jgi:ATPase subunit of ABC transporter with duplicated ATPase domains
MVEKNASRGGVMGRFAGSVAVLVAADAVISMAHGCGMYVGGKYKAWRKRRDERIRREARQGKKKRKRKNASGRASSKKAKKGSKKKAA